jgi:hypothetical protein
MTTKEPQPFSLSELAGLPMTHDPDPENPSTGCWVGKIKPSTLERVYELRLQESRRRDISKSVTALNHIHDHLVGLAQDIEFELQGSE